MVGAMNPGPAILALATILAAAAAPFALAAPAAAAAINCLDVDRGLVSRMPAAWCKGRIIGAEEAAAIEAARIERIRRQIDGKPRGPVPGKRPIGSGSGFFVGAAGELVTNHHVIKRCAAVSVTPATGEAVLADVIGIDKKADLALLRAREPGPAMAVFDAPASYAKGDPILIIGYPLHGRVAIRPISTAGHVLGSGDHEAFGRIGIRLKADVRRGNSGGPALDRFGRVIAVVTAKINTPAVYRRTGKLVRHVGIAIEGATVRRFLDRFAVKFRTGRGGPEFDPKTLLARAERFIARVRCWG